jgi:adenine C2-methylase RlmN of 23S rRNA A2503 and tRNA A37
MNTMIDLRNLTRRQVTEFVVGLNLPAARGSQLFANLYRPGLHDISLMTDINRDVRARLAPGEWLKSR